MTFNIANWPYFAFILILLVLAEVGDYFHLVPSGTFASILLVALGLIAPSPLVHTTTTSAADKPPTNNG